MGSEWKVISGDREAYTDDRGYVVVRPIVRERPVPLFCDVCDIMMRTDNDVIAWKQSGCCHHCHIKWAAARSTQWAAGWRPSDSDIADEVKRRRALPMGVKLEGM